MHRSTVFWYTYRYIYLRTRPLSEKSAIWHLSSIDAKETHAMAELIKREEYKNDINRHVNTCDQ